jgi:hypothetical protein
MQSGAVEAAHHADPSTTRSDGGRNQRHSISYGAARRGTTFAWSRTARFAGCPIPLTMKGNVPLRRP